MSSQQLAKLAGLISFVQIFLGSFPLYVRSNLIDPAEIQSTITNVASGDMLFRLSMLSDVFVSLTWLSMAMVLFLLFQSVQREISICFLVLVVVGVAAIIANITYLSNMLALFDGSADLPAFDQSQRESLGMMLFGLFKRGEVAWSIYAGLWLIPLGCVVLKSGYVPKAFGLLLILASLGYVLPALVSYVSPTLAEQFRPLIVGSGLVEISFGLWLLIIGIKSPPNTVADASTA